MATIVLNMLHQQIELIKSHYTSYITEKVPPGSLFQAKLPNCTITAYRSGKVMFQGKSAEKEAAQWQAHAVPNEKKQRSTDQHQWAPPKEIEHLSMIGSDEVGTGDYFGPVTIAAAFVHNNQVDLLKELGVKDSKYLSDLQITNIAKDLIQTIPYSLLILHNKKYNELQRSGMSQGKMKAMLHNRALLNVIEKVDGRYDGILIDQFANPDVYFRYLSSEKQVVKSVYFATRAEGLHLSVAAASIIARYSFITEMNKLSNQLGISLPKGAGKQVDEAAAQLIIDNGEHVLTQCAKLHFANTQKAINLAKRKRQSLK